MIGYIQQTKKEKQPSKKSPEKTTKPRGIKHSVLKTSEILKGLFVSSLEGWKDDKEKFKTELINDIKSFLFEKWEKPWKAGLIFDEDGKVLSGFRNISGRLYKNSTNILSMERNGSKSPYFITISALRSQGGKLIDKLKVISVLSYIPMFKDRENKTPRKPDWMLPKLHLAVNVDYCEGIKKPVIKEVAFINHELNEYVENFLQQLISKKRVPKIYHDQADQCHYKHTSFSYDKESIHMVDFKQFHQIDSYYSVLFHEITHSTKNPKRLGRGKFGTTKTLKYANEELVAEMGAMIICTELGLKYNRQNGLVYLKGWLKSTTGDIDENLLEAYGFACDAADYLLKGIDLSKLVPKSMIDRAKETPDTDPKPEKKADKKKEARPGETASKKIEEKKEIETVLIPRTNPEELNYDLAYRAYTGTSFSPEKRAVSQQKGYANLLNEFAEEIEGIAKTDQQKELAVSEFTIFKERLLKKLTALLVAKSRCMSTMITGSSNFPVRSNQKKLDTEHKRLNEYIDFNDKAQKGIIKKIKRAIPKELADKQAFEEIENRVINYLASIISIIKGTQVGSAPHFRALLGSFIKTLSKKHQHEYVNKVFQIIKDTEKKHEVTIFSKTNKIWNLENQTDGARVTETGERVILENSVAKLVNNLDAERIQIITEDKPSEEARKLLKSKAFRWSPRFKAWQRINTSQAIYIAKIVFAELFPTTTKEEPKPEPKGQKEQLSLFGLGNTKAISLDNWKPNTHIITLKTDLGKFIGGYERNRFAMVLRGEKGAGKTRLLCQAINLFASQGLKCLFKSLEVSPESELFGSYTTYIDSKNKDHVFVDADTSLQALEKQCKIYDCIAIDSWGKLGGVDQGDFGQLVEKYPKVIWLVIFQSTTSGTARGGIMSEYDSSLVVQVAKGGNAVCEKNRYNSCDLTYNVFTKKLLKDENIKK
ncbi:zincin-like metallopeptidase domain-containing protein [Ancylomarina sp.]|uniref:zincin-like metallopeptidase domain-containing protein n=1 Tax=Ancylomarina sp. TaxID=1970196 RepID=UPI0035683D90